ncbi:MAG: hypothetical protein ACLSB9_15905 [Hydrogeniiclostridium mannosilyticum]
MNDSFGHHPKLHTVYNHHEQASAIAAEGYARIPIDLRFVVLPTRRVRSMH